MRKRQTRDGFINTCERCEHQKLCHALVIIQFEDYLPGSPGYIPLFLCDDEYSEKTIPVESAPYNRTFTIDTKQMKPVEARKLDILAMIEQSDSSSVTPGEVSTSLEITTGHAAKILASLLAEERLMRHKDGKSYRYYLPGDDDYDSSDKHKYTRDNFRQAILEALRLEPLTTPQIHEIVGDGMSLDATRNHVYRLHKDNFVQRVAGGGGKTNTWAII